MTQSGSVEELPDPTGVAADLLAWHDPTARRLAFRAGTDAWGVLVSEVMSQQTQASRAGERWTAFMERFPTPGAMAEAGVDEVLSLWVGLGYNRRALNLHRAAVEISTTHDGQVPLDLASLLALPGVGPYTARAVLAFAADHPVVPVDTNVARVLARLTGRSLSRRIVQTMADALGGASGGGAAVASALMDLGAGPCRARQVDCGGCPLAGRCAWLGGPEEDPARLGAHRPRGQSAFQGSARQARGAVVRALTRGWLPAAEVHALAGSEAARVIGDLVMEGLVVEVDGGFALPGRAGKARGAAGVNRHDAQREASREH